MTKVILLTAMLFCSPVFAEWVLDPEGSYLGFASVKNDLIAENHAFTRLSGAVDTEGRATVIVDLTSVETMIPIRNERMQKMLFDVASYPAAKISGELDLSELVAMQPGGVREEKINLMISLHGKEITKSVAVKVTRSVGDIYDVSSLGPILVHASQFGLADGVDALRKIAGLQSIDLMVPVSFDLRLIPKNADS